MFPVTRTPLILTEFLLTQRLFPRLGYCGRINFCWNEKKCLWTFSKIIPHISTLWKGNSGEVGADYLCETAFRNNDWLHSEGVQFLPGYLVPCYLDVFVANHASRATIPVMSCVRAKCHDQILKVFIFLQRSGMGKMGKFLFKGQSCWFLHRNQILDGINRT